MSAPEGSFQSEIIEELDRIPNRVLKKDTSLNLTWGWPDALFGGMLLISVAGLIYLFNFR